MARCDFIGIRMAFYVNFCLDHIEEYHINTKACVRGCKGDSIIENTPYKPEFDAGLINSFWFWQTNITWSHSGVRFGWYNTPMNFKVMLKKYMYTFL